MSYKAAKCQLLPLLIHMRNDQQRHRHNHHLSIASNERESCNYLGTLWANERDRWLSWLLAPRFLASFSCHKITEKNNPIKRAEFSRKHVVCKVCCCPSMMVKEKLKEEEMEVKVISRLAHWIQSLWNYKSIHCWPQGRHVPKSGPILACE